MKIFFIALICLPMLAPGAHSQPYPTQESAGPDRLPAPMDAQAVSGHLPCHTFILTRSVSPTGSVFIDYGAQPCIPSAISIERALEE